MLCPNWGFRPDDNAMFDPEAAAGAGTAISFVIGTKLDLSPAKSGGRDVLASELGAGSAHINSTDPGAMKPGTQVRHFPAHFPPF